MEDKKKCLSLQRQNTSVVHSFVTEKLWVCYRETMGLSVSDANEATVRLRIVGDEDGHRTLRGRTSIGSSYVPRSNFCAVMFRRKKG